MEKTTDMNGTTCYEQPATICGYGNKKRLYVSPQIEVTYVKHQENLLTGSGKLRVIAKPEVENWVEEEESSHEWLGF